MSEAWGDQNFHWTAGKVCLSLFLFLCAGVLEIGGGWATWQAVRGRFVAKDERHRRPLTYALAAIGALSLAGYGCIVTAQPPPSFGRLYAVYGGFFIIMSYLWGYIIDHDKPDKGPQLSADVFSLSLPVVSKSSRVHKAERCKSTPPSGKPGAGGFNAKIRKASDIGIRALCPCTQCATHTHALLNEALQHISWSQIG